LFALFNILTGMLVEKAVEAAAPDRDDKVLQENRKKREDALELLRLCKVLDTDGDGNISRQEFETMLKNTVFASYMASLGLEVRDVSQFFSTVAGQTSEDAQVSIEQFAEACVSMRGTATSVDMHRQLLESSMLRKSIHAFEQQSSKAMERIEELNSRTMSMLNMALVHKSKIVNTQSTSRTETHTYSTLDINSKGFSL